MHIIHLTEDDLKNIRTFLARTELRGHEVDAFNKVVQRIESPMSPQKTDDEILNDVETEKLVKKIIHRGDLSEGDLRLIVDTYYTLISSIVKKLEKETREPID